MGSWSRFNGAVASQPRKGPERLAQNATSARLQWGRGFAATEGVRNRERRRPPELASMGPWLRSHGRFLQTLGLNGTAVASMGPWLRSHGRVEDAGGVPAGRDGFNGAVASQPRKGPNCRMIRLRACSLQWGRGFAATEGRCSHRTSTAARSLQWGRGFAATEGCRMKSSPRKGT